MKTPQVCKDEVALKHGHASAALASYRMGRDEFDKLMDEAAELYAQSAKAEAWDEGRVSGHKEVNPYKS